MEDRGLSAPQSRALQKVLAQVFPLNVVEKRTAKGNLSAKSLTWPVTLRLGSLGFEEPAPVALPGTSFGLEPDFFRRGAGELGAIAGELQLGLRECVPYDFLKHAMLQRMGICATSIQIVPAVSLSRALRNACATFEWAKAMLDQLVLPVTSFRVALVGLELVAGQSTAATAKAATARPDRTPTSS
jgi:hypothetical protein